jgi:phytoene dehydrogenase-like protein
LNSFYVRGGKIFDVGLHALTNYTPKHIRGPLTRLLRQLRLTWDELSLAPQLGSAIMFPGVTLEFSNDFSLLESQVDRHFPKQKDGFRRLVAALADYGQMGQPETAGSARQFVSGLIDDPLLVEMLFCPLLFYGSAREHDMDLGQFSVLFRSIFLEGFARPPAGVRWLLDKFVRKFRLLGGELRLRTGVRHILARNGRADGVVLDDGTELEARTVLSSAGWPETLRMCGEGGGRRSGTEAPAVPSGRTLTEALSPLSIPAGGMSIIESISLLDRRPRDLGLDRTIVFYNDSDKFHYERPAEAADLRSGVICAPGNFTSAEPPADAMVRLTALANYDRWASFDGPTYRREKQLWYDRITASAVRFVPDFRSAVTETDVFTPVTLRRFTGHDRGAVYGAVEKRYDGTTHLKNLFLCGNDQGLVGIVGTVLSGIGIANKYLLKAWSSLEGKSAGLDEE